MKTICMYCNPNNQDHDVSHGFCNLSCMHKWTYLVTPLFDKNQDLDRTFISRRMQRLWEKHIQHDFIEKQILEDYKLSYEENERHNKISTNN